MDREKWAEMVEGYSKRPKGMKKVNKKIKKMVKDKKREKSDKVFKDDEPTREEKEMAKAVNSEKGHEITGAKIVAMMAGRGKK